MQKVIRGTDFGRFWVVGREVPSRVKAERRLFSGPGYRVGQFVCPPESKLWEQDNRILGGPLFVFPSAAVEIQHAGQRPVIADPNQVVFYNKDQVYRRRLLDQDGDRSIFCWLEPQELLQVLRDANLVSADDPDRPFGFSSGPGHPTSFLRHLELARYVFEAEERDHLFVQESLLWLFRDVTHRIAALRGSGRRPTRVPVRTRRSMDERVREVQRILALRFAENLSLAELGQMAESSPYHLAREFRRRVGTTIHAYRTRLRLLHALGRLQNPRERLVDIAFDAGFSSHSHFTLAFREVFGRAPSKFRAS